MTQDTNNQEWWMEEFDKTFKKGGYEIHRDEYGHGKMRAKRKTYQFNTRDVKAFIRKVSQQSREDALKECIEVVERNMYESNEKLMVSADNLLDWLKSKLSS